MTAPPADPPAALLLPIRPLNGFYLQLSSRCNLRCVYCPQALSSHATGEDMPDSLLRAVKQYARPGRVKAVGAGFYGETLVFRGWEKPLEEIRQQGVALSSFCSNFSRVLSRDEAELLSRFQLVFLSFDAVDQALLSQLRPGAEARTIIYNQHLIRGRSHLRGDPAPDFAWNCTLAAENVHHLKEYVAVAISCGVKYVFFNEVVHYDNLTPAVRSVFDLAGEEFLAAAAAIDAAVALAKSRNREVSEPWRDRLEARRKVELQRRDGAAAPPPAQLLTTRNIQGRARIHGERLASGMTRDCADPWQSLFLMPDGGVFTCCARGTVMGKAAAAEDLDAVLENSAYRDLRRQLLTGEVTDEVCAYCQVRPAVPAAQLRARIERLRQAG